MNGVAYETPAIELLDPINDTIKDSELKSSTGKR